MKCSLYQYYSQSPLSLYEVRRHFLWNFYCQDHSRNDARKVLKAVVASSKIGRIIDKSLQKKHVPNYREFLFTIKGMFKFWFCSKETLVLATIEAILKWDIVANKKLGLKTQEELKQDTINVLKKYLIHKEVSIDDILPPIADSSSLVSVDLESTKVTSDDKHIEDTSESDDFSSIKIWTLDEFTSEFGPMMQVKEYANGKTGDLFKSCVFTKGKTRTFVSFSSKLGEHTKKELLDMKDELIVMKVQSGKYKLAKHYYT
nr:MAG TPA: hypothetical protein [Crassvirales sp.]